jgi:hypothetical protein
VFVRFKSSAEKLIISVGTPQIFRTGIRPFFHLDGLAEWYEIMNGVRMRSSRLLEDDYRVLILCTSQNNVIRLLYKTCELCCCQ